MIPEIRVNNLSADGSDFLAERIESLFGVNSGLFSTPHRVSYYGIFLVIEGHGNYWIDENKHTYESGTLISISRGQVGSFNPGGGTKGFALLFSEEYLYRYPDDIIWINNLKLFDPLIMPIVKLSEKELLELVSLYLIITNENKTKTEYAKEDVLRNLLRTFLLIAERYKRITAPEENSVNGNSEYLNAFRKVLEEHYHISRSVNYYADLLNVTPRKLNEIVSNYLGKSAKKIIEERILLETKRLLAHTDCTIKEIGSSLGFTDPTNFNKFFRKHSNRTPASFRSSLKTENHYKSAAINHF